MSDAKRHRNKLKKQHQQSAELERNAPDRIKAPPGLANIGGDITLPRLVEVPVESLLADLITPGAKYYTLNGCFVYWRAEPNLGYHISISHPRRYPTWDEVVFARYQLTPANISMALLLPPLDVYSDMAKRSHGFELWQVDGAALRQDVSMLNLGATK